MEATAQFPEPHVKQGRVSVRMKKVLLLYTDI